MKRIVQNQVRSKLDTETDTCLYQAPRDEGAYPRGRDLYLHPRRGLPPLYYIHRWTHVAGEEEGIGVISASRAGQFLEAKGIICEKTGDDHAAEILRSWGYGILEEF